MFLDNLPQELFADICTRLPIKSIVHVGCVCKSFHAIIKNPNFITEHINRSVADDKKTQLLLLRYHSNPDNKERFSIRYDDEIFDECMTFDNSYKVWPVHYYKIVGSCNGLICLCDYLSVTSVLILWNPALRKSFNLPMPPTEFSLHDFVVGFGFNSSTNDFKVVRIGNVCNSGNTQTSRVSPEVEVYELSTGLWRGSSAVVPPYEMIPRHCSHVFVKGASHWIAFEKGKEQNRYLILSFDMGSEVFGEMVLPASVANGPKLKMSISLFGESLSLFCYDGDLSGTSERCCIWVMQEYGVVESWIKLFTVDLAQEINKVLGFRRTGEVLVEMGDGELVSYDPESKEEVHVEDFWFQDSSHLDTYMESLVLLDGKDQVSLNRAYCWNKLLKEE
ncbi:F-box/kelch-repeat protein At3g23880-like [Cornus florida]|uniref:F-box/kelch-repeat protein At3g23880-like n=1 Tax=Cornus florida TaxID=4283 RepID=UPI00289FB4FB|nr:F-box/kelch-repeat protein At3g23880-like [Cornus florida]